MRTSCACGYFNGWADTFAIEGKKVCCGCEQIRKVDPKPKRKGASDRRTTRS